MPFAYDGITKSLHRSRFCPQVEYVAQKAREAGLRAHHYSMAPSMQWVSGPSKRFYGMEITLGCCGHVSAADNIVLSAGLAQFMREKLGW